MEKLGSVQFGDVYKTREGNTVGASKVDGRQTKITENSDGTYKVTVTHDGKTTSEKLTATQLANKYAVDAAALGINVGSTNNAEQAQQKYGDKVANKFFAVA